MIGHTNYHEIVASKLEDTLKGTSNQNALEICAHKFWWIRLWYLVSNPFFYLFVGRMRW